MPLYHFLMICKKVNGKKELLKDGKKTVSRVESQNIPKRAVGAKIES